MIDAALTSRASLGELEQSASAAAKHLGVQMNCQPALKIVVMHGEHLIEVGMSATLSRRADIELSAPCPVGLPRSAVPRWLASQSAAVVITDYERGLWLAETLQPKQASLRSARPRIVIVTSRTTQAEIRAALKKGVAGYLTVASSAEEVVDAVRRVHIGERHVSERLAQIMLDDMLGDQLTPRESEVLQLAARGCPNKVIATRLQVELGTVKCHMKGVLDKLRAGNRTHAVVIANQRGLLAPV